MTELRVLFCCMGNICRSPMAEGLFRKRLEEAGLGNRVITESAGTHAHSFPAPPDPRAQRAALERGIDISQLRSRRITRRDFATFDLILAMDAQNVDSLRFVCPKNQAHKIRRLLDYAPNGKQRDIPDPFTGGDADFTTVLDLLEQGTSGLLQAVITRLEQEPP